MRPFFRFNFNRGFAFSAALLVLGFGVVLAFFNQESLSRQKLQDLDIEAAILAQTAAAPMAFGDASAAHEIAVAMSENPEVQAVALYGQNDALLASFVRPGAEGPPTHPTIHRAAFHDDAVDVVKAVGRSGQTYGSVYLRLQRGSFWGQLARYAPIALLVLMAALVLAVAGAAQGALARAYAQLEKRAGDLAEEIEQRKHAEEALLQSRKMEAIGQLTGGVAHDFNNLLMVISGGIRMLRRSDTPERREKTMAAMDQAVERGAGLTRQLLSFARREAIKTEPVNVFERLMGMRELLERSLRADILLDITAPSDLPAVATDGGQLELVILNLCVNARDAMPKGGLISIGAHVVKDMVEISVRDTGSGIEPGILARIFEPYFTTKAAGQGTGLGLAHVYGLAQQSGGAVRVESQVGQGTIVYLALPITNAPAPVNALSASDAAPEASLRLLVVEDEDGVAATVLALLEELGHDAQRASNAADALKLLNADSRFDALFSDIIMPGEMNGVELATAVRRLRPTLPILLTTGYSGREQVDSTWPILRKPYQLEELRDALKLLLSTQGEGARASVRPDVATTARSMGA